MSGFQTQQVKYVIKIEIEARNLGQVRTNTKKALPTGSAFKTYSLQILLHLSSAQHDWNRLTITNLNDG